VLGEDKVPGNIVLCTFPRKVGAGGKGGLLGGGGQRGDKFYGTCQVLVGEGNLHGIHGSAVESVLENLDRTLPTTATAYLHTGLNPGVDVATLSRPIGVPFTIGSSIDLEATLELRSTFSPEKRNIVMSVFPNAWRGKQGASSIVGVMGASTFTYRRSFPSTSGTGSDPGVSLVIRQGTNIYLGNNIGSGGGATVVSGGFRRETLTSVATISTATFGLIGTTTSTALTAPNFSLNPNFSQPFDVGVAYRNIDRKSTRLNSSHTAQYP
jgi:hypothetical protein